MIPFYGPAIISPRGNMSRDEMIVLVQRTKMNMIKLHIGEAFSTDPIDVMAFIEAGVKCFILRTDDGLKGYSYEEIQRLIENAGGIAGYSYGDLMHKFPDIEWWLEIGNEPDLSSIYHEFEYNPWSIRWWSLAVIKELKLNTLGHIEKAWSEKYPMLKWCLSLPTQQKNAQIVTQYMDFPGDDMSDGGILDYYDAIGIHLYGDTSVLSWNYDWPYIYNDMIVNKFCKKILVTELGINDPTMSHVNKAYSYKNFIANAHSKVHCCAIWVMARGSQFPNYELNELREWEIMTGYAT